MQYRLWAQPLGQLVTEESLKILGVNSETALRPRAWTMWLSTRTDRSSESWGVPWSRSRVNQPSYSNSDCKALTNRLGPYTPPSRPTFRCIEEDLRRAPTLDCLLSVQARLAQRSLRREIM
jgi:hypothetical protein